MKQKITYKNGHALSYADYGEQDGYPILIQHGLIASIDDYELFNSLLKLNTRLICIARPGYGESSPYLMESFADWAKLVTPLIEELGLTQFDVLGISSGAPYSYSIGYGFPDKARNIFILSGTPALYDEVVLANWPYPRADSQNIEDLQALAHELFFSTLSPDDLQKNDIRDSTMNHGFGVAQDLRLRYIDWGFRLSDVKQKVFMCHSRTDDAVPFETAVRTSQLLPNCQLELLGTGPHFSPQVLDDFIINTMMRHTRS